MKFQQCFDILEAFAYTKKGSLRTISNTIEAVQHKMYQFNDIDQAILLANALVEVNPKGSKTDIDFQRMQTMRLDTIQKSIDYI